MLDKTRKVVAGVSLLLLVAIIGAILIYDDARKPVVHRSVSTGEITKVEVWGKEIPIEEFQGGRHHTIRVR